MHGSNTNTNIICVMDEHVVLFMFVRCQLVRPSGHPVNYLINKCGNPLHQDLT